MIHDEKPMLPLDGLIHRMEDQGVQFNIETKQEAREYLESHNYYFKVMTYRENYHKHQGGENEGKYVNMEFAYLHELANIDCELRYIIILMLLDIEHYLKVKLLHDMSNNPQEDGYAVVAQFIDSEESEDNISKAKRSIEARRKTQYCDALIQKYQNEMPAWAFVELISFGELISFYDFYQNKYGIKNKYKILLNSVRDLRNVAAHSNCLLNKLSPSHMVPHNDVVGRVRSIDNLGLKSVDKKLHNQCLFDLTALIFAYDEIVTEGYTKQKRMVQLKELVYNRMPMHKEWFSGNALITSSYQYFRQIVDHITRDMV